LAPGYDVPLDTRMRGWLVVGPWRIAAAAIDEVAGLRGARHRTVPRRVVPGQRGIVTGHSRLVFCWAMHWPFHEVSWPGSRKKFLLSCLDVLSTRRERRMNLGALAAPFIWISAGQPALSLVSRG
jgi:uncharacterized protein YndB with AHSA1/START domain